MTLKHEIINRACGIPPESVTKRTAICGKHFRPEDYKPEDQRKRGSSWLLKDAVPSLRLPTPVAVEDQGGAGVQNEDDQMETEVITVIVEDSESEEEAEEPEETVIIIEDGNNEESEQEAVAHTEVSLLCEAMEISDSAQDAGVDEDDAMPGDGGDAAAADPKDLLLQEQAAQIEELKQQLTEKDKEIEELKLRLNNNDMEMREEKKKIRNLKLTKTRLEGTKKRRIEALKMRNKTWRETYYQSLARMAKLRKKRLTKKEMQKELLKDPQYTPAQVKFFLFRKDTKRWAKEWTTDELNEALIIRCKSKSTYLLLRKNRLMALPGLATLNRHIQKIRVTEGLMHSSLAALRKQIEVEGQGRDMYRAGVLSFDEIKTGEQISYDAREDQVVPSTKNAQICMLRGLFHPWKQPIYVGLDQPMTKSLFEEVVAAAEEAGVHVEACVNDMGGSNRTFWQKIMGVNLVKDPSVPNPVDPSRKIDLFSDVPHLLKLLRNHYLDAGYVLPNGARFVREDLEELLKYDSSEMQLHWKLTPRHFNVTHLDRQRVFYATQLFSNRTADLLEHIHEEKADLINFVRLVDRWFDVFNSRVKNHDTVLLKSGYGVALDEQNAVIDEMYDTILKIRQIKDDDVAQERTPGGQIKKKRRRKNSPALKPFQEGIAQSCVALRNLYARMKAKYNTSYLLTSKLNQGPIHCCCDHQMTTSNSTQNILDT